MDHHNPYVTCPYNEAHEVPKLRMQRHLLKCRKQYPYSTMKTCPFNATHIMPERELQWHFRFCADKTLIEGKKYNFQCDHGELGNPTFHPDVPKGDWDDFEDQDSLEPQHNSSRHHNYVAASRPTEDEDTSNGALSMLKDSRNNEARKPNLTGFGRGHLHYLVAKMNNGSV